METERDMDRDTERDKVYEVVTVPPMSHKKSANYCIKSSSTKELKKNMPCKIMFQWKWAHLYKIGAQDAGSNQQLFCKNPEASVDICLSLEATFFHREIIL
jgi:hypothetical protein